jgi:hypothetical protein
MALIEHAKMKSILPTIALGLFVAGCGKIPDDASINHVLIGKWGGDDQSPIFYADGSFTNPTSQGPIYGSWCVKKGTIILNTTYIMSHPETQALHLKIVSMKQQDGVEEIVYVNDRNIPRKIFKNSTPPLKPIF